MSSHVKRLAHNKGKPGLNTRGENGQDRTLEGREKKMQSIH